jgi:lipopolysaccharide transport system permease protein
MVPERWQLLYSLNPMVGVIEGCRWALFGTPAPHPAGLLLGVALVLWLAAGALFLFRRADSTFADIV